METVITLRKAMATLKNIFSEAKRIVKSLKYQRSSSNGTWLGNTRLENGRMEESKKEIGLV